VSPRAKKKAMLCGKIVTFAIVGKCVPLGGVIVLGAVIMLVIGERHVKIVRVSRRDMQRLRDAA